MARKPWLWQLRRVHPILLAVLGAGPFYCLLFKRRSAIWLGKFWRTKLDLLLTGVHFWSSLYQEGRLPYRRFYWHTVVWLHKTVLDVALVDYYHLPEIILALPLRFSIILVCYSISLILTSRYSIQRRACHRTTHTGLQLETSAVSRPTLVQHSHSWPLQHEVTPVCWWASPSLAAKVTNYNLFLWLQMAARLCAGTASSTYRRTAE